MALVAGRMALLHLSVFNCLVRASLLQVTVSDRSFGERVAGGDWGAAWGVQRETLGEVFQSFTVSVGITIIPLSSLPEALKKKPRSINSENILGGTWVAQLRS